MMACKLNEENISRRMWWAFGSNLADTSSRMMTDNRSLDVAI